MAKVLASVQEVRNLAPDAVFKRGKELVSANKFNGVSFEGQALQKSSATCSGSNPGDSYNISVLVNLESPYKPLCQCSCPAASKTKGSLCKHVVGLLLLRAKEFERRSKENENELVLSEPKQAEYRLAEKEPRESLPSDSQATEPFTNSEKNGKLNDCDTAATASSGPSPIKSNQKRVLPSWLSTGLPVEAKKPKKDSSRSVSKQAKISNQELDEGKTENTAVSEQGGDGTHSGEIPIKRVAKRKDAKQQKESSANEDKSSKATSRTRKQTGKGNSIVKNYAQISARRRKAKPLIDSDLSEGDEPNINDETSSEANEDIDLTSEDLTNLAKKYLDEDKIQGDKPAEDMCDSSTKSNGLEPAEDNSHSNTKQEDPTTTGKRKGSTFSLRGLNKIAETDSINLGRYADDQHGCDIANFGNSQCSKQILNNVQPSENISGSIKPSENIVDDMLGLFFGPTLSKTVNSKLENTQPHFDDILTSSAISFSKPDDKFTSNSIPISESDVMDIVLPTSTDAVPKPKKKSSLKDQVMMFLG